MSHFWKARDGRWRRGIVAWVLVFLSSAIYDFVKQGWGSLSAISYLLWAAGAIALAPMEDESREGRATWWYVLHSRRYAAGAVACIAAAGIFLFRLTTDINHLFR